MKYAKLDDADLAYEVMGDGTPILFVHGFLANGTGPYYRKMKEILAIDHKVIAFDIRSHGGSNGIFGSNLLEQSARDVVALSEHLGLARPFLVGHSMGGFIAMLAASLSPGRFGAAALLTPAASKGAPLSEPFIEDFMTARLDPPLMRERFAAMFTDPPPTVEILDTLRDAALCLPDPVAEHWVRKEWPRSDIQWLLPTLALPVLSLIGAKDVVVSPQQQYEDAKRIPAAKVVTFNDEGHMLPLERPDRCTREVLRFFQDLR